jgi:hypothetical protein
LQFAATDFSSSFVSLTVRIYFIIGHIINILKEVSVSHRISHHPTMNGGNCEMATIANDLTNPPSSFKVIT